MKKSLLALALLGAFTASAFAEPSVTLYGRIDTGLVYTHKRIWITLPVPPTRSPWIPV